MAPSDGKNGKSGNTGNGWNEWQKHVLAELARMNDWMASLQQRMEEARREIAELARMNDWMASLQQRMDKARMEIAELKVKAGGWGAIAGAVVVVGTLLTILVVSLVKG